MATIDECKQLLQTRANDRGASSNISPAKFNIIWPRAELKFFNNAFKVYADTQVVSDAISKWLSDPLYIFPTVLGRFDFFTNMRLLHVDSLNGYLLSTGTTGSIGSLKTPVGGSGYTNGTYDNVSLTGGTGTGAKANITVTAGVATITYLNNFGSGYTHNDVLTATIPAGTGFSITVDIIVANIPYDVTRVEKNRVAAHVSSNYDAPDREFSIYTQFSTWLQFYPESIGVAQLVYLKNPIASFWGYKLKGYIATLTGLTAGTLYTTGTYTNVPLTGGSGTGALATIIVSGGGVSTVTVTNSGKLYLTGDVLSALAANIGGTGSGFTTTISSIANPRPVYDAVSSVQPLWSDADISLITDYCLEGAAISARDTELQQFAQMQSKSTQ